MFFLKFWQKRFVIFTLFFILILLFISGTAVAADNKAGNQKYEYFKGVVESVLEDHEDNNKGQFYQKLKIKALNGSLMGHEIIVENGGFALAQYNRYKKGDILYISYTKDLEGKDVFYILGYSRERGLLALLVIFIVSAILVAGKQGLWSLISMIITFFIVIDFTLRYIQYGYNPVLISFLSALIIIPVTFYMFHGFKKKVTVSVIATLVALLLTIGLAVLFMNITHLTGAASEEAVLLKTMNGVHYNLKSILLAGIIIGTLGVLDDVTVGQAGIVFQLFDLRPDLKFLELYKRSIEFGKDHIPSMINTLILVYAGASLPLLLLFLKSDRTFGGIISYESIVTEIVRTLVGSIGLMISVPITALLACFWVEFIKNSKEK